ncbi:hypothetical protein BD410DRAFT_780474 [Rickenella mellea]|uniref:Uncharacterized protein n=1 Tax=Rickenella mellea TaxID=50990 RepID=A0A4R5XFN7_9AGAM|nr:hypothetical protein BD410DRAFT_780474 [Rickenella mellea]
MVNSERISYTGSYSLTITPAADAKNRTPNPMNFECKLTAENNCSCIKPTNIGTNVENPRPSQNLIGAPVIVTAHLCFTILISGQLQSHPSRNQLPFPSLL